MPSAPAPSRQTAPEDRVPIPQKIGYGLGTFHDMWGHWLYPTLAYQVFNIFLNVSPALVGLALMLNRLFDAISDPFFGWWSDNTRSKYGRRRPFILIGGILAGIGLPLLFLVGPGWGSTPFFGREIPNYFWFMLASSAVYIPIMSCFNMPYQSLGAELTPDYHERTSVMAYKRAVQTVAEVGMFVAAQVTTLAIFNDAMGKPNILLGAQVYCAGLGVLMIIAAIAIFLLVKERYYTSVTARQQGKISIKETLWETLQCRPFRIQLAYKLAYAIGTSMVGTLGYYATVYYVCKGDLALGARWNTVMGLSGMVFGLLGVPAYAFIARRLGKRYSMMCVLGSAIVVFIGSWWLYNPEIPWLQPLASGFIAFTAAGFWMIDGSIAADIIDYDELNTGKRREGAYWACGSWITKVGLAIGAGAAGVILSSTGFDASLGANQTEHSIFMIRLLFASVPLAGLILAIFFLLRFPLSQEKMAEIRAALEQRRGKV